jgi:hypothetical protein
VATAVALTLQGMLGLICDPIGGLVEIPCIYRNASAAMQAVAGAEMALAGLDFPVSADEVIDVMGEVGRRMPSPTARPRWAGWPPPPSARRLVQIRPSSRPSGIEQLRREYAEVRRCVDRAAACADRGRWYSRLAYSRTSLTPAPG